MQPSVLAPRRQAPSTLLGTPHDGHLAAASGGDEPSRPPIASRRDRWASLRALSVVLAVSAVLIVSGLATGANVAGAPHYESDEGTYVGSAWSMFEQGKLSYYTYNYDHPPLGWFVLGLWARLVGGFLAFGSSVATGRVLMVVVAMLSATLILGIVKRATGSLAAGLFAALLFSVSPLATSLHRQVWLDNMATFWLLVSLYAILGLSTSLRATLLSAVAFGLSFWTKEVMAVFFPAMLFLVGLLADAGRRRFAIAMWALTASAIISVFVLMAFLKDELLPPGILWSSSFPHVSLLDTYSWQISRGGSGSIVSASSDFRRLFAMWWSSDPVLVMGGLVNALLAAALFRVVPVASGVAILALTFLLFLARGGIVIYYYIIPILALFALLMGLLQGYAARMLGRLWRPLGTLAAVLIVVSAVVRSGSAAQAAVSTFVSRPTLAQDEASAWMIATLPRDSVIIMDSYGWVEMQNPASTQGAPFPNAHYYWPAVSDPSVRDAVLHGNWQNIDYIALSPSLEADIANRGLAIIPDALAHADDLKTFSADDWSVRILRVRKLGQHRADRDRFLTQTWTTYKKHYLKDGQVVNPQTGMTTSEGQAYALLRAVYLDDRDTFDQVWSWTHEHLQVRPSDALLAWAYGGQSENGPSVMDINPATDADQDTAMALLFASKRWNTSDYADEATRIISDIWDHEIAQVAGQPVLVAGTWATGRASADLPDPIVNPSYFAPYAYRIFATVDRAHPWQSVIDSSYDVLARIRASSEFGGTAGVVPNWVALDEVTGELKPADVLGANWSVFAYDASRVPWRLSLDWLWYRDNRARDALAAISLPYARLKADDTLAAAYDVDGRATVPQEATSMYAATLAGVLVQQDRALAQHVFTNKILRAYRADESGAYWGDLDDFNDQNWSWFATALMDGGMANLWNGETVLEWDNILP